jgi:hypothetical protein
VAFNAVRVVSNLGRLDPAEVSALRLTYSLCARIDVGVNCARALGLLMHSLDGFPGAFTAVEQRRRLPAGRLVFTSCGMIDQG